MGYGRDRLVSNAHSKNDAAREIIDGGIPRHRRRHSDTTLSENRWTAGETSLTHALGTRCDTNMDSGGRIPHGVAARTGGTMQGTMATGAIGIRGNRRTEMHMEMPCAILPLALFMPTSRVTKFGGHIS